MERNLGTRRLEKMIISVTKKDIENGRRYSCKDCPIATAIQRQTTEKVEVFYSICFLGTVKKMLPRPAVQWILDFDAAREVKPIRFEI